MKKRTIHYAVLLSVLGLSCASRSQAPTLEEFLPSGEQLELFDGESLDFWEPADFGDAGKIEVKDRTILLHRGAPAAGMIWSGPFRQIDYELFFEIKFSERGTAAVTLPVDLGSAALLFGEVAELCCTDGDQALKSEVTGKSLLEAQRWHRVRVRVIAERIQSWIDDRPVLDAETAGKLLALPDEFQSATPPAIVVRDASASLRNIVLTLL